MADLRATRHEISCIAKRSETIGSHTILSYFRFRATFGGI